MRAALAIVTVTATAPAAAIAEPTALAPQAHADLGLSIVGVGYERPVTGHVAVQAQGGIFGTYFLPWFDRGDDVHLHDPLPSLLPAARRQLDGPLRPHRLVRCQDDPQAVHRVGQV